MSERQRVAAQTRKKPEAQPQRRTATFKRPYLTPYEVEALVTAIESTFENGTALVDPSLASAVAELKRWV